MLNKLPILVFFVIVLQLAVTNDVYALDRGTGNGFKRDSFAGNYYARSDYRKSYRSSNTLRNSSNFNRFKLNHSFLNRHEAPVFYNTVSRTSQSYRGQRAYRSNKNYKAYSLVSGHRAHLGGTQYSQKDNFRSRDDVIREVKRRHNCEILKVSLDERKQQYKVRVLMPNGKVRNLKISARR